MYLLWKIHTRECFFHIITIIALLLRNTNLEEREKSPVCPSPGPSLSFPMCNYYDEFVRYPVHIFYIFITNACIHKQYTVVFYAFLKMYVNGIICYIMYNLCFPFNSVISMCVCIHFIY